MPQVKTLVEVSDGRKDIRWEQLFSNYRKALGHLKRFLDKGKQEELSDLEKQGLVKAFKYTYELAWTTLKDFLVPSNKKPGSD